MRKHFGSSYLRRPASREPYDTVLIVCEGEKTEPNYFRDLMLTHRLSSANIVVVSPGADPVTLVEHARQRLADFDRVYCVFDGDNAARAAHAADMIGTSAEGRAGKWHAIRSTPCFEMWLLLHFKYSTAPFVKTGKLSPADCAIAALKTHLPKYAKGHSGLYGRLSEKVVLAMANGRRLEKHNATTQSANPATQVHNLVDYLRALKRD